jgi:nitroreductase
MHPPAQAQAVLNALKWRYATQHFDPNRPVDSQAWSVLLQCLALAPSSYGLQPWRCLRVSSATLRQELLSCSYSQTKVVDAPRLLVLAVRTPFGNLDVDEHFRLLAEERGLSETDIEAQRQRLSRDLLGRTQEALSQWASNQLYLALGVLVESAALLGIDCCPMEGFDARRYDSLLGLAPMRLHATIVVALGHRALDDPAARLRKIRLPLPDLLVEV